MAKEDKPAAPAVKTVKVRALVILEHNKVRRIPDSKNQDFDMPADLAEAMAAKGYVKLLVDANTTQQAPGNDAAAAPQA